MVNRQVLSSEVVCDASLLGASDYASTAAYKLKMPLVKPSRFGWTYVVKEFGEKNARKD